MSDAQIGLPATDPPMTDLPVTDARPALTIAGIAALVARRELSPVDLAEASLARAEKLQPQLDAFLLLTRETALAEARRVERRVMQGEPPGPMAGVPYALKDIVATAGLRTTGHSRTKAEAIPKADAACVTALRGAGGVLIGKLATHEFAHGGPSFDLAWPPARNPWNIAHFTGGSSSGSGAAVAAGIVPAAIGTDTGGSIRLPAALCGIVGLKPTYGLVSRRGVYPNSYTYDNVGPMTWTVEDCAIMLGVLAGHDPDDPASADRPPQDYRAALGRDLRGLRIAVVPHFHERDIETDPEVVAAFDAACTTLRRLGATIEPIGLRPAKHYSDVKVTIAESELFAIHADMLRERPGDFGEDFFGRAVGGVLISGADYVQAQRERRLMLAEFAALYRRFDAFITPTAPAPAPPLDAWRTVNFWQKASFTTPFNVSGGPALSQCMGFSAAGLPLGLQVAGRPFDEATVLRIAHAYERATPWRDRRPVLRDGAAQPPLPAVPDPVPTLSAAETAEVAQACRRAGLTLTDRQLAIACVAAPHVAAMTGRLRRARPFDEEPANVFRFANRG